jgi:DNA-binding LacI/PurR family transcriptional regulator
MATRHLISQGYHNIGLITGPMSWVASQQRKMGWQDALSRHSDCQIYEGDWSAASGALGLSHLLDNFPQIDAVFAFNDQMALGVLQAAHEAGCAFRKIWASSALTTRRNRPITTPR